MTPTRSPSSRRSRRSASASRATAAPSAPTAASASAARCRDCRAVRFYPRAVCPACLSSAVEWIRASGRGTVYTFTVTQQNQTAGFREELPYVLAMVELEEGPRLVTNLVGCAPDEVRVGMPVEVAFEDGTAEITLPKFRPA